MTDVNQTKWTSIHVHVSFAKLRVNIKKIDEWMIWSETM